MVVFGRTAHGERLRQGCFTDGWRVRRGDRLLWADRMRLSGDLDALLAGPFTLGGAVATLLYAAEDAGRWLEEARAVAAADGIRAGAASMPVVLLVRWLARDAAPLRRALGGAYAHLRARIAGLAPRLPVLWSALRPAQRR